MWASSRGRSSASPPKPHIYGDEQQTPSQNFLVLTSFLDLRSECASATMRCVLFILVSQVKKLEHAGAKTFPTGPPLRVAAPGFKPRPFPALRVPLVEAQV